MVIPLANPTVAQAAQWFAENAFDQPRKVNPRSVRGAWIGKEANYSFKLTGGIMVYTLTYRPADGWNITGRGV
jgi:hypothetical protein